MTAGILSTMATKHLTISISHGANSFLDAKHNCCSEEPEPPIAENTHAFNLQDHCCTAAAAAFRAQCKADRFAVKHLQATAESSQQFFGTKIVTNMHDEIIPHAIEF